MNNDELKKWLEQQRQGDITALENALGMEVKPDNPIGFADIQLPNEEEAKEACIKLKVIPGIYVRQNRNRVIVQPETLKSQIETIAKREGWRVDWYTTIPKGQ
jgi:hypothetical protein